jgi:hypothetical protein
MLGPISVADYIERVRAQVPALRVVGQAADLASALKQRPSIMPVAYVVAQERARPADRNSGGLLQQVDAQIIVITFVAHAGESREGASSRRLMDTLIAATRLALVGWRPPSGAGVTGVAGLALSALRDEMYGSGAIVTQQVFETTYDYEVIT